MSNKQLPFFKRPTHIAPLVVFRIVFGAIMCLSICRFIFKGWIRDLYIEPDFFFTYYGFDWVEPLAEPLMYLLFGMLAISFLFQAIGLFYRASSIFSFSGFTYIELIDKTNYLNHYYFVSIICLLLIFVPANKYFSIDVIRNPKIKISYVARYLVLIFQLQLAIVYFYAGIAKLNYDWLLEAMPLKIWLPSKSNLPIIGTLLQEEWLAYLASWFGAIYDLSIPFLLFYSRTRWIAYFFVIVFHLATYFLFQIGMFPFIMIGATLIFFSADFHLKVIGLIRKGLTYLFKRPFMKEPRGKYSAATFSLNHNEFKTNLASILLSLFFALQLLLPFRYVLYPNNLYWSEEGYRFSWRVMLMEKAAYAIFHVFDPESGRSWEVNNYDYLTMNQEKMMSTQPDMILQFAHFLEKELNKDGIKNPKITAEVYVTLNGRQSQLFIDPTVDLTEITESFKPKEWVLPMNNALQKRELE